MRPNRLAQAGSQADASLVSAGEVRIEAGQVMHTVNLSRLTHCSPQRHQCRHSHIDLGFRMLAGDKET